MKRNSLMDIALTRAIRSLRMMLERDMQQLVLLDSAIILSTLPDVVELDGVREQLANRLREQLNVYEWIEKGDTYEVFSVLVAVWQYSSVYVTGEHLAAATQRLIKTEVTVGGPYRSKGEVTTSANAQIAMFMRLVAKPLPNVDAFLAGAIATKRFDEVVISEINLIHLLSKASSDPKVTQYVAESWRQDNWQTPAHLAMALAILKGKVKTSEINHAAFILSTQQLSTGFWHGESTDSSYVITALIVGTLTDFARHKARMIGSDLRSRQRVVAVAARRMFSSYAEPLRSSACMAVDQICRADKNFEITLLPHFFADALRNPDSPAGPGYAMLSLASVYVWIAYTIYDDFLDGEGDPKKLPIANIAMRASLESFRAALPARADFQQYVERVFAGMDEINAWEVSHCRFTLQGRNIVIARLPSYSRCAALAARSFAHALGPMALLAPQSLENKRHIESAFRHYLIARQLDDDLHDWLKDLKTGQASYVVTAILRDLRIKPGTYILPVLVLAMQKRFRRTTMLKVCRQILRHTAMSKREFLKTNLLRPSNNVYTLLDSLEMSVQRSLDKHSKAQDFTLLSKV